MAEETQPTPSGSNFAIEGFVRKAEALGGFLRTSKFAVQVQGPARITIDTLDVNLYCTQASFPTRKFSTGSKKIYGSEQAYPYTVTFDESLDLTFFCTDGMKQRNYFEAWQNLIQNPMTYNMGFHKDYAGTVSIGVFPENHSGTPLPSESKYIIVLEEAWPEIISSIDLNSGTNELMKFSVNMSYKRWFKKEWVTGFTGGFSGPGGATPAADAGTAGGEQTEAIGPF